MAVLGFERVTAAEVWVAWRGLPLQKKPLKVDEND